MVLVSPIFKGRSQVRFGGGRDFYMNDWVEYIHPYLDGGCVPGLDLHVAIFE